MGCDIHIFCEVKKDGKWQTNTDPVFEKTFDWDKTEEYIQPHPPCWRNYHWFSILADVRNYHNLKPIAEPRGKPDDITNDWTQAIEDWGSDLHSITWLSLSDFETFDWSQTAKINGIISFDKYKLLRGTNKSPTSWSRFVGGFNILTITEEEANKHIEVPDPQLERFSLYVDYFWKIKYDEWFASSIKAYIEPLRELSKKYEDVRFVFGFDN